MAAVVESHTETEVSNNPWRDFVGGSWQDRIDVRDFIQRNYTPYEGDEHFLTGATVRTKKLWEKLTPLFDEEQQNEATLSRIQKEPRALAGYTYHQEVASRESNTCHKQGRLYFSPGPLSGFACAGAANN